MRVYSSLILTTLFTGASVLAATVNFGGTFRSEATTYNNLGLGNGGNPTKSFIAGRALLVPNLIVDDHFSVKSQWTLLTSPNFTPRADQPLGVGQGSYIFGDANSKALFLSRAWLEWTSDIGVFRLGRMPVSWGYGVVYDSGDLVWDDFQTTMDRLEYRIHLGYVVGTLAYSKSLKNSVLGEEDDQEFYTAYLRYDNPEMEVETGLIYEKQQRSSNQGTKLTSQAPINPYVQPALSGSSLFPLSQRMPYPLSSNLLDLYVKKTSGYFTYGGEISWISGSAVHYTGSGTDNLSAFGVLMNATFDYRKFKVYLEGLFASGDNNLDDGNLTGFVVLNRNRRPGLIMGRELLGKYYGNNVAQGSPVAYGSDGTFSGVLYFRPGVRIDWSSVFTSTAEVIYGRKVTDKAGQGLNLGVEIDISSQYAVYKNFLAGLDLGALIPGDGYAISGSTTAFAVRSTASVSF